MTEEFKNIIGAKSYSAFVQMLRQIGPDARTHRISVVIAAMLRFALSKLLSDYHDGPLAQALLALDEKPYLAYEESEEYKVLFDLIDRLCGEAGMRNERESARGMPYSIGENTITELAGWYNMPWED
jgi:hypothetical protein